MSWMQGLQKGKRGGERGPRPHSWLELRRTVRLLAENVTGHAHMLIPLKAPTLYSLSRQLSDPGFLRRPARLREAQGLAARGLACGPSCCPPAVLLPAWRVISDRPLALGGAAFSLTGRVPPTYLKTTSNIAWSCLTLTFYCAFSNAHPLLSDQWVHW